jgi:hypothetical protein
MAFRRGPREEIPRLLDLGGLAALAPADRNDSLLYAARVRRRRRFIGEA